MNNHLFHSHLSIRILILLSFLLLPSCGGGGNNPSGAVNTVTTLPIATQVALVEASSANLASIDVSWLPAFDGSTPASQMKYAVHVSIATVYTPSTATLAFQGTGVLSTKVIALQPGTKYTVMVVATSPTGYRSVSQPLIVTTSSVATTMVPGAIVTTPTTAQIINVSPYQVTLSANAPVPSVGQFIASASGNGLLRKVTQVTTVGGQTVVQTQPASLNQVVSAIQFSTSINLSTVPATVTPTQAGVAVSPVTGANIASEWQWADNNLRLVSETTPPSVARVNQAGIAVVAGNPSNINISSKMVKNVGNWATFTGPDTIGIVTGTSGSVSLDLNVTRDDTTFFAKNRVPISLCHVEILFNDLPSSVILGAKTIEMSEKIGATSFYAMRSGTQELRINAVGITPRPQPYVVKLRAYVDEAKNQCSTTNRFFIGFGWKEKLDITVNIVVVSGKVFPTNQSKPLTFSGGFNVTNDVTFTFEPSIEAEVSITNAIVPKLAYARLEAVSRADITQTLTVIATGASSLDKTLQFLAPRKFVKVFMAGSIPIVMAGVFSVDIQVQGSVTGSLIATEELKYALEDMRYGFIYQNGVWSLTKNLRISNTLKLSGAGNAEAQLTVTLLPKLNVTFYESATGHLVAAPNLKTVAGVHGQVTADITPQGVNTNSDYWLTKGELSVGVDAYVMADLSVLDYTIAQWPKKADPTNYNTFRKIPLLPPVAIAGLPSLTATVDWAASDPTDSRAILIKGTATDVPNPLQPLFGGPASYLPFSGWTTPLVLAPPGTTWALLDPPTDNLLGNVWVRFDNPGDYTVRLGGNSSMGGWARQIAEASVSITDNNNNAISDQWENKFGLTGTGATIAISDPDGDGCTNQQEYKAGTFPLKQDGTCPDITPPIVTPPATLTLYREAGFFAATYIVPLSPSVTTFLNGATAIDNIDGIIATTSSPSRLTTEVIKWAIGLDNNNNPIYSLRTQYINVPRWVSFQATDTAGNTGFASAYIAVW